MENKTVNTVAKSAYGKTLATPIPYTFSWSNYESIDEVRAAKDELKDDEVVKFRNDTRQAKARTAAYNKALADAGIEKPTLENDPQYRLKNLYETLMANKTFSHEQAREAAKNMLGIDWED